MRRWKLSEGMQDGQPRGWRHAMNPYSVSRRGLEFGYSSFFGVWPKLRKSSLLVRRPHQRTNSLSRLTAKVSAYGAKRLLFAPRDRFAIPMRRASSDLRMPDIRTAV